MVIPNRFLKIVFQKGRATGNSSFFTVRSKFLSFFEVRSTKKISEYFDQMTEKLYISSGFFHLNPFQNKKKSHIFSRKCIIAIIIWGPLFYKN